MVVSSDAIDDHTLVEVSKPIVEAFQTTGFLFLLNSGVTKEEVTDFNNVTGAFFRESFYNKQKFSRKKLGGNHGWVALEVIYVFTFTEFCFYSALFQCTVIAVGFYCLKLRTAQTFLSKKINFMIFITNSY